MSDPDDDVNVTVYRGGKIVATDDIELDMDIYTLNIKGTVVQEDGGSASISYVDAQDDALQASIDALTARVEALENPA